MAGGPGSGKSKQCAKLFDHYGEGFTHISVGGALRSKIASAAEGDSKWSAIRDVVLRGGLAPDDTTVELVVQQLKEHEQAKMIVIEGFPRNPTQVEEFNKQVYIIMYLSPALL